MLSIRRNTALAAAAALFLAGCGSSQAGGSSHAAKAPSSHAAKAPRCISRGQSCLHVSQPRRTNPADRAFLTGIIADERRGVELAHQGETSGHNPQVRSLAAQILAGDEDALARYEGVAKQLGIRRAPVDRLASERLSPAGQAAASPADPALLAMTITQTKAALKMADGELARGYNFRVTSIASNVVAVDGGQLAKLRSLKRRLRA